jgi:hypothetical protein
MECAQESGLINENTQSGLRMIFSSDKILWSPHRGVQRFNVSTFQRFNESRGDSLR